MPRKPPRLACFLVRDDNVLGDLIEEYNAFQRSNAWFWQQAWSVLWLAGQRENSQRKRRANILSDLWIDLRFAARTIEKSPGFAAVVVLAIALGVGVNTAIFTLFNSLALRPLPVPDARRVVGVYQLFEGNVSRNVHNDRSLFSYSEYKTYRDQNRVFSGLAAYDPFVSATLAGESPRYLMGELATCNYFSVLGVQPAMGRAFSANECSAPGSSPVVILSDNAWRSIFASDPAILGKSITINRVALTVIGVAPPGFHGGQFSASDFWAPLTMDPLIHRGDASLRDDNLSWLVLAGRLKNTITLDQARANLSVIARQIDRLHPGRKTTMSVDVATYMSLPEERQAVFTVAQVIFAAVSLVLLIACANVANLLLSRSSARQKEIALRLSIGASRARLIRQLLTESIVLAVPGGLAGGLAAWGLLKPLFWTLISHIPGDFPAISLDLTPDSRVLAYTLGLTLLTGIVFGLAPAIQASRPDLTIALKAEGSGSGTHRSHGWLRSALVVAQVSVCLVLLIAAGLVARGLQASQTIQPGFRTDHVFIASFDLNHQQYDEHRAGAFHRMLGERVASLPGVDSVAQAEPVPLSMTIDGSEVQLPGRCEHFQDHYSMVSPEFFSVLGIPIVRGRNFTPAEMNGHAKVAIVTESTARKLWPGQDPLGKTFTEYDNKVPTEIIGVARDSHTSELSELDPIFFYFPLRDDAQSALKVLVHSRASVEQTTKALRDIVRSIDPNVVLEVRTMDQNLEAYRSPAALVTQLATALGAFALLLATIGIYSVVSYAVSRRVREVGIRIALGAERRDVLSLVLRGAMRPVFLGIVLGLAATAAVSRILSSVLYGVSPLDPVAFAGVTLFLVLAALLASFLPALRATRIDPNEALRYE